MFKKIVWLLMIGIYLVIGIWLLGLVTGCGSTQQSQALSSKGTITGYVKDGLKNVVLAGASVEVKGASISTTTEATGAYTLINVPTGVQTIEATKTGYGSSEIIMIITSDQITEVPMIVLGAPYQFLLKWGSYGSEEAKFLYPSGMSVDKNGNIYIADQSNNRIQKFDSLGNFLLGIGSGTKWANISSVLIPVTGTQNSYFNSPNDVAVDKDGNIYVVEGTNARIQKFDSSGNLILGIGNGTVWTGIAPTPQSSSLSGAFNSPRGITVDNDGNIYIADYYNHRIQKLDNSGNLLFGIGNGAKWTGSAPSNSILSGFGNGYFFYPSDIAVDNSGNIYVLDSMNYRIQKFDNSGNFIKKWGGISVEEWAFSMPYQIAIKGNNIFLVDAGKLIIRFDLDGNYLGSFKIYGNNDGELNWPLAIAVDGDYIYVSEKSGRIQKFRWP